MSLPPGARLVLRDIPVALGRRCGVGTTEKVTFTQLSATPYQFRDAVRFSNGQEIRLQDLNGGMRVDVLSLSEDFEHEERRQIEEEYHRIFN